jgi:serine/threonine protein kinase
MSPADLHDRRSPWSPDERAISPFCMTAQKLAPGAFVDDKYRIKRSLGFTGTSHVVLAHDVALDRRVAIKFLGRGLHDDASWRERFLAEARNLARVRHQSLVQLHSYGVHDGFPFVVMGFVQGSTLAGWLREHPRPSVETVVAIVRQMAAALEAIHRAGLAHHDVHPENVLIDDAGHVVVMAFGLSMLERPSDRAGEAPLRAVRYLAPEQAAGCALDVDGARRADIYQLGATAFELLVGSAAFGDGSPSILERARARADSKSAPRPGGDLARVVLKALASDPADRYPSALAFANALDATLAPASVPPLAKRSLRVLLAEDDSGQLHATRKLLQHALPCGSSIEAVDDGLLALVAAKHGHFDLLLLDLHMPSMGAVEVAEAIAAFEGAKPSIIVLTASGGADDWRKLRTLGVDAMLLKPFDIEELTVLIDLHVRRNDERRSSFKPCLRPCSAANGEPLARHEPEASCGAD